MARKMIQKILYSLLIAILACSITLPFAQPVYADTLYLRPNAAGDETAIDTQFPASGAHWDKVDEAIPDEGTTYVSTTNPAFQRDLYNSDNTSQTGTINWIKVWMRTDHGVATRARTAIKTGGTVYDGADIVGTSSWANNYTQYFTNPQAGGAWTWAQLNDLQAGVSLHGNGVLGPVCTQVYIEVNYITTPTVTTQAVTLIEETTATGNGNITSTGGEDCSSRGVEYDIDSGAPYANSATDAGSFGTGAFTKAISSLTKGELYYLRAKATNSVGTGYGSEVTFLTKPDEPNTFTATGGVVSGRISLSWVKGTGAQKTYIRGKIGSYPTSKADGTLIYNDTGTSYNHDGLTGGNLWYYRAWSYATEGGLEQYSDLYAECNATAITMPIVTTTTASSIAITSATLNGNITDDGGTTITNYGFVWDTVSRADPGNVAPAASAYSDNWTIGGGFYSEGAINHPTGATLVADTIYYCRAAAQNSIGWSYGTEVSFETIGIPTVSIQSASNVASTVARLNALITNDNGQACVTSFAWAKTSEGPFADWAAIIAAPSGHTDNATGTWVTGQYPYLDIGSLTVSTGYTFMARVSNDAGLSYSAQATFPTSSGVGNISNFTAIPTSTTISLAWVKGTGASNTVIRYRTSTYPTDNTSGTFLYGGVGNSYLLLGLTEGTNYYFSGWGLTAGVYSDNATMVMATTLAAIPTDTILPTPATPSSWNLVPSTAGIVNVPFYEVVNVFADSYEIPIATMWYGLAVFFSVALGLLVYWRGNKNLLAAIVTTALGLFIGAILGLVYLWVGVFFCVIALAMAWLAQRY